ncbi:MAG: helix-turn-helix domain-containing protein [Oscillospiraceae bacterium]|nr:helix-turn-helix domain-containing protein [Oscillospiraceae bacterium]
MNPVQFGAFLKEERSKKNLTQAQLAEELHVTPAAVSKWERGICLPELTKLEDLAKLLDVSMLELLQCQREEEELPGDQAQLAVYRETLQTERQQQQEKRKKKLRRCLTALAALILLALLLYQFPIYYVLRVWNPSYYSTGEIELLMFRGTRRDQQLGKETTALAETAFSTLGLSREEAEERFGALAWYCYCTDYYPEAVSQEHVLQLWTARFPREGDSVDGFSSHAYVWVCYWQRAFDENGDLVSGSGSEKEPIPSLWILERQGDGSWKVIEIKEHP